jgi:hypothetical protein
MNKTLKLAVAGAVLAMSSAANAGIVIPAGDWTVDINGNVNAFYIHNDSSDSNTVAGGLANTKSANSAGSSASSINTGLLPSWLGITGKKRENDLDISWTISFQPGASNKGALQSGTGGSSGGSEFRQANLTFGDKSWGTIKIGKDLGLFGADAILNDQTLLGVGSQGAVGAQGGTTTTLGRIGTGFLYADFTGQIAYTSPNWNGFQFTAEIAQPWSAGSVANSTNNTYSAVLSTTQRQPAFEGNVNYSWAGDVSGKIWLEGFTQSVESTNALGRDRANVYGIGGKVGYMGAELVGYYYNGEGVGTTGLLLDGVNQAGNRRDSDGGYIQASFKVPGVGTKLAASWGESNLDLGAGETNATAAAGGGGNTIGQLVKTNEMWTVGAYHPLTSNLNLVAEYSRVEAKNQAGARNKTDIIDFGAILFF